MNDALMKEYEKTFMDKVTVIHAGFDEKPHTVAFVMVDKTLSDLEKCEEAFMKTNTIDEAWWTNDGVVYIQYPRQGLWTMAFISGRSKNNEDVPYFHLFVPTTPNPTSGFFLMIPQADTHDV